MKNKRGFSLAEVLIALGVLGVIATIVFVTVNSSGNKQRISDTTYRKIYNDLYVASQYALINGRASNKAFEADAEELRDDITKYMSVNGTYEGFDGYTNLTALEDNANNIKGAKLQDGHSIAFIAENDGNLRNRLEQANRAMCSSATTTLVGVIVINTKANDIDPNSIIPVYKTGLGSIPLVGKTLACKAEVSTTAAALPTPEPEPAPDPTPARDYAAECTALTGGNGDATRSCTYSEDTGCTCTCTPIDTNTHWGCATNLDNTCSCKTHAQHCADEATAYNNNIDTNNYSQTCTPNATTHKCECSCSANNSDYICKGGDCNKCMTKAAECEARADEVEKRNCEYNEKSCKCECIKAGDEEPCFTNDETYICTYFEEDDICKVRANCNEKYRNACTAGYGELKSTGQKIIGGLADLWYGLTGNSDYVEAKEDSYNLEIGEECECCIKEDKLSELCRTKVSGVSTNATGNIISLSDGCKICECKAGTTWDYTNRKCVTTPESCQSQSGFAKYICYIKVVLNNNF